MPCGAAVVVVLGHFCIVALRSINEFQGIRVCLRKVHCQDIKAWLKLGATAKNSVRCGQSTPNRNNKNNRNTADIAKQSTQEDEGAPVDLSVLGSQGANCCIQLFACFLPVS